MRASKFLTCLTNPFVFKALIKLIGQSIDLSSIVPLISSLIITSCSGPDNNLSGENA